MLLVRKITSYHSFVRYIKAGTNEVSDKKILEIFKASCIAMGLKKPLKIYTNPLAASTMLVGIFSPFVVVPNIEISEKELHNIFIHEIIHYKKLDVFYKWLTQFTVCIHWYNPLIYLVSREINKNCELSCDETIIKRFDDKSKRSYGDTLLAALKFNGNYSDTIVSITLNEDAKLLKERLNAIMKFKQKSKINLIMTSCLTIIILGASMVTGAYAVGNGTIDIPIVNTTTNNLNEADKRGIEIMENSGTWGQTMEEVLPYMTKTGIDKAVEIYNQKHSYGEQKVASDYYNYKTTSEDATENSISIYKNKAVPQKTKNQFNNEKINSVKLNITDCPNVIIQNSDNENIQYEYYEFLYDISTNINNNELTITVIQKPNVQQFIKGNMENFISILLPEYIDEKIIVNAINSGVIFNEYNINYEIVGSNSISILYIPKNFDKNISCNSKNGSVITYFYSSANNYTFSLSKDDNSFATLPNEFTNYKNSTTYKYVKGNSVANIDISLKSSHFLAQFNTVQSDENTKEAIPDNTNDQANPIIQQNNDDTFSEVDNTAITLMEYTGNWEIVENFIPNMSKDGIDRLAEIYNQKNQHSSLAKKKSSDYYNMDGASEDVRALALIEATGTWQYPYALFPHMTNDGIDKVVEVYNQRHKGNEKVASDYYNVP